MPAKALARRTVLGALRAAPRGADAPALYVRVNSDAALNQRDLDIVMAGAPDGIMLPKAEGGADIERLSARLAVREASHQLR